MASGRPLKEPRLITCPGCGGTWFREANFYQFDPEDWFTWSETAFRLNCIRSRSAAALLEVFAEAPTGASRLFSTHDCGFRRLGASYRDFRRRVENDGCFRRLFGCFDSGPLMPFIEWRPTQSRNVEALKENMQRLIAEAEANPTSAPPNAQIGCSEGRSS